MAYHYNCGLRLMRASFAAAWWARRQIDQAIT
jgi:hypothetical protein